jgi:hypothetical protein
VNGGLGEAGGVRGAGCNGAHEHTHDSNRIESHGGFFGAEPCDTHIHTQPGSHHRCQQRNFTQLASKFQPRIKQRETTIKKLVYCGSLECNGRAVEGGGGGCIPPCAEL